MSSLRALRAAAALLPLLLSGVSPALAQNAASASDRRLQDLIAAQKGQTDLRDKRCLLPTRPVDEIVVCGAVDPDRHRAPLRETFESVQSTDDGLPRAPDFAKPSCKGQPGCISFGGVPSPVYYVDVEALPKAPVGSDADLIGKGEKAEP